MPTTPPTNVLPFPLTNGGEVVEADQDAENMFETARRRTTLEPAKPPVMTAPPANDDVLDIPF